MRERKTLGPGGGHRFLCAVGVSDHFLELPVPGQLRVYPGPPGDLVPGVHGAVPGGHPPVAGGGGGLPQPADHAQLLALRHSHHSQLGGVHLRGEQRPCPPGQPGVLHRAGGGGPHRGYRLPGKAHGGGDRHLPVCGGGHRLSHPAHGDLPHSGPAGGGALCRLRGAEEAGDPHRPDIPVRGDPVGHPGGAALLRVVDGPGGGHGGGFGGRALLAPPRLRGGHLCPLLLFNRG